MNMNNRIAQKKNFILQTKFERQRVTYPKHCLQCGSLAIALVCTAWLFILASAKEQAVSAVADVERRLSEPFVDFGLTIKTIDERPDHPHGSVHYLVKDAFTTANGSFDPSSNEGSIPQWARDAYLSSTFLEAGASNNLFAAVIGLDGQLVKNYSIRFWSDGFQQLGNSSYQNFVNEKTKQDSGWANITLWGSSAFYPANGQTGPWCWMPEGAAEVVCGGGLPNSHMISTFVVWQAIEEDAATATITTLPTESSPTASATATASATVVPTITPIPFAPDATTTVETATPSATATPNAQVTPSATFTDTVTSTPESTTTPEADDGESLGVTLRMGSWVDYLRLNVQSFAQRPDAESKNYADEKVVYRLKDLFTTRNGQWDPSDLEGSVDAWARDGYLKPLGAPDYFDDAGADHHLFAAIIGLDGTLIADFPIAYWSDGFDKLADPEYNGFVYQSTKTKSGWANIAISKGSSYVPERGEQGPWCWAPSGASDVVCGAGLPANKHVSTFAVWQAVLRADPRDEQQIIVGEFSVFLPFITQGEFSQ